MKSRIRTLTNEKTKRPAEGIIERYITAKGLYSQEKSENRREELKQKRERRELSFHSLDIFSKNYSFGF